MAFSRTAAFAKAKEPKKCHVAQVGHCKTDLVAMKLGHLAHILEDAKSKRLDARRRRVLFRVKANNPRLLLWIRLIKIGEKRRVRKVP
jgi:hypothetical protein